MEDEGDDDRPPTLSELNTSPVLKRTQNPNYYLKSMKPVGVDLGLEFHEKLIHKVDHSLKSTKFRLHQTELLLNLEPPLDEVSHHEDWEATIEDLLSDNHRLEFPKFSQIQKQSELNLLLQKQTKEQERAQSRQEWNRRASMILAKETLNLQKKILAGKCQFGGSVKGVPLKTIQNYKGVYLHSCYFPCLFNMFCFFFLQVATLLIEEPELWYEKMVHDYHHRMSTISLNGLDHNIMNMITIPIENEIQRFKSLSSLLSDITSPQKPSIGRIFCEGENN
jgi:hypothetical protein